MRKSCLSFCFCLSAIILPCVSFASHHTSDAWAPFLTASSARFEAEFERAQMMPATQENCRAEISEVQLKQCLENDVFVRQAIERHGFTVEEYVAKWKQLNLSHSGSANISNAYHALRTKWQ